MLATATTIKNDYGQLCAGWNKQTSCGNIGKTNPIGLTFTCTKVHILNRLSLRRW